MIKNINSWILLLIHHLSMSNQNEDDRLTCKDINFFTTNDQNSLSLNKSDIQPLMNFSQFSYFTELITLASICWFKNASLHHNRGMHCFYMPKERPVISMLGQFGHKSEMIPQLITRHEIITKEVWYLTSQWNTL